MEAKYENNNISLLFHVNPWTAVVEAEVFDMLIS
jgi:hypothetical protein